MKQETGEDYFGYADPMTGLVLIRSDLPADVITSVTAHEVYHIEDIDFGSIYTRELRANIAGFKASPKGWFHGIFLSLTPSRIWLYVRRIFGKF